MMSGMTKPTEADVTGWREEHDRLVNDVLARPSEAAHFQSKERIDGVLAHSEKRERRIIELSDLIATYEADNA
jgi:hypothetical protein